MNNALKLSLRTINSDIERAVGGNKISGAPFVSFSSDAAEIFGGFSVLLEQIHISLLDLDDDDQSAECQLNDYERGALLRMMQATAQVMASHACDLATWAETRIKGGRND